MIRLDNISKTFRDGDTQVQALKNISFEVNVVCHAKRKKWETTG